MRPPGDREPPDLTGTVENRYDIASDERPSLALVRVVSDLSGEDPQDLRPVHEIVDLDGLDRLLGRAGETVSPGPWVLVDVDRYSLAIGATEIVAVDPTGESGSHRSTSAEDRQEP